jgi:hypothetical protein
VTGPQGPEKRMSYRDSSAPTKKSYGLRREVLERRVPKYTELERMARHAARAARRMARAKRQDERAKRQDERAKRQDERGQGGQPGRVTSSLAREASWSLALRGEASEVSHPRDPAPPDPAPEGAGAAVVSGQPGSVRSDRLPDQQPPDALTRRDRIREREDQIKVLQMLLEEVRRQQDQRGSGLGDKGFER